jgi:hypothetical protein
MLETTPTPIKYIFLDIVKYTKGRTRNAQRDIIEALNPIVRKSVEDFDIPEEKRIYLPTGDGMCIALLDINKPFDIHLQIALRILKGLSKHNKKNTQKMRQFDVRIGINDGEDLTYTDINHRRNVAGDGINMAARIMGVADKRQILVGDSVFKALQGDDKYESSFKSYIATVKHDLQIPVHQFVAPRHEGLDITTPDAIAYGLNIYSCRDESLKKDLLKDVKIARSRVWLLGVGLSEEVSLKHDLLKKLVDKKVDVRILLLDASRSPAVFRSLLEMKPDSKAFEKIINNEGNVVKPTVLSLSDDPYFSQPLYQNFEDIHKTLADRQEYKGFKNKVRFYAHAPSCWLAIIDNKAYFQPYTFGRSKKADPQNLTIGNQMPVFKFQSEINSETFSVLEDHFDKLWMTSDAGLFHVGARIVDRDRLLRHLYDKRHPWLKQAGEMLRQNFPRTDRRYFTRQCCESHGQIVTLAWGAALKHDPANSIPAKKNGRSVTKNVQHNDHPVAADIVDYSCEGVLLKLKANKFPKPKTKVRLEILETEKTVLAAVYLFRNLLEPTNYEFRVVWVDKEKSYVALSACRRQSVG